MNIVLSNFPESSTAFSSAWACIVSLEMANRTFHCAYEEVPTTEHSKPNPSQFVHSQCFILLEWQALDSRYDYHYNLMKFCIKISIESVSII